MSEVQVPPGGTRHTFNVPSQKRPWLQSELVAHTVPTGRDLYHLKIENTITIIITNTATNSKASHMEVSGENYSIYEWEKITETDVLFRAKANQVKILLHRGYDVPATQVRQFSWSNYEEYKRKRGRFAKRSGVNIRKTISEFYSKEGKNIYVAYVTETEGKAIKTATINDVVRTIQAKNTSEVMFITSHDIHQDSLKNLSDAQIGIEIYKQNFMGVDRLSHVLNPAIQVMSQEEKKEFFDETGLSAKKIAKYATCSKTGIQEPIVQHYKYPKGTLVKIMRNNDYTKQVCTESVYWRVIT